MTRKELKSLIKECLVEILTEGLGGSLDASVGSVKGMAESRQAKPRQQPPKGRQFDPRLDAPVGQRRANPALSQAIAAESGGNPLMASILADTANTTLQEMLSAESRGPSAATGHYERQVEAAAPEDLFGEEAAGRWADLAFADIPRSNTH